MRSQNSIWGEKRENETSLTPCSQPAELLIIYLGSGKHILEVSLQFGGHAGAGRMEYGCL